MSPVLEAEGLAKRFGAVWAVDGVSLAVRPGELLGLIGPNGAGKTTLFNLLTGFVRPDRGSVRFAGRPVDGLSAAARTRRGLVRTFQRPLVFPALAVTENIAMAARLRLPARAADAEARRLLAAVGLRRTGAERMRDLSHGEVRVVDVLMALALRPRLLLLDEPTAGLASAEAEALLDLVRREAETGVLIAHDVPVVMRRCDRVGVLQDGRLLRLDVPDRVRADPAVRRAYLGPTAP